MMRLIDRLVDFSQRESAARIDAAEVANALPLVILTCIDPRLNGLFPGALGLEAEQVVWLRNAGNIIFDPLSSMTRTLALACAVKGGKEIAIIGHTDCRIGKMSIVDLTDRFRALGIDRKQLPENIHEFFGLFASERQNVLRGVDFVRRSPLIGPGVPVHGLLLDLATERIEVVVNGYDTLATAHVSMAPSLTAVTAQNLQFEALAHEEIKMPEWQIGSSGTSHSASIDMERAASDPASPLGMAAPAETTPAAAHPASAPAPHNVPGGELLRRINKALQYRVIGTDNKTYGPVTGAKIIEWLTEGRVTPNTPVQVSGTTEWRPLAALAELARQEIARRLPTPPKLSEREKRGDKFEHGPYL